LEAENAELKAKLEALKKNKKVKREPVASSSKGKARQVIDIDSD
jgi:hypothetical protein